MKNLPWQMTIPTLVLTSLRPLLLDFGGSYVLEVFLYMY